MPWWPPCILAVEVSTHAKSPPHHTYAHSPLLPDTPPLSLPHSTLPKPTHRALPLSLTLSWLTDTLTHTPSYIPYMFFVTSALQTPLFPFLLPFIKHEVRPGLVQEPYKHHFTYSLQQSCGTIPFISPILQVSKLRLRG